MPLYTYDPKKVTVNFFGVPIHGFADGTFVTVSRDKDTFTKGVGSDGEVIRSKMNDRSGRFTLTLQTSSDSNIALNALAVLDSATQDGIGPFTVKDASSLLDLALGAQSWIVRQPDMEKALEAGTVEWQFDAADIAISHGGLNKINP